MRKVLKKLVTVGLLSSFALGLSACQTTRDERILIGTALGIGIGAGISASTDEEFLASIAIGGAAGATLGFLSEDF